VTWFAVSSGARPDSVDAEPSRPHRQLAIADEAAAGDVCELLGDVAGLLASAARSRVNQRDPSC
jgi:hypothetical protein